MNLMSQEEGALLKPGDFVKVYWFTPRKPKGETTPPSRFWDGRTEWLDSVWEREEVTSLPHHIPYDGWSVTLKDRTQRWLTNHMEKLPN